MRGLLICFVLLVALPAQAEILRYSTGTGFYVNKLGHVVTNAHVLPGCRQITVAGRPASLVGMDTMLDIAVLKVTPSTLTIAPMRQNINNLSPGEKVVVMGFPGKEGFNGVSTYRTGTFIERSRFEATDLETGAKGFVDGVIIDPIVAKGNSGGPVMDAHGRVIGVIRSMGQTYKTDPYGRIVAGSVREVAMAIPLPLVRQYLDTLRVSMLFEHGGLIQRTDARMQQEARKFILPIRCLK